MSMGIGCEGEPSSEKFRIRVTGLLDAHEAFTLKVDGHEITERFFFEGGYIRELELKTSLQDLNGKKILVRSEFDGETVGQTTLEPFLCAGMKANNPDLAGWNFTEEHGLVLTNEGDLRKNEDLDRNLSYTCNAIPPNGEGGEGVGTSWSSEELCVHADRSATKIALSFDESESLDAETCSAGYAQRMGGLLAVAFGFPQGGKESLTLGLMEVNVGVFEKGPEWDSIIGALPLPYVFTDFEQPTTLVSLTRWNTGEPVEIIAPLTGTWKLRTLTWGEEPRLTGEVDLQFVSEELGHIQISGVFDLPVHRSRD